MNTYLAIGAVENGYVSRQFDCSDENDLRNQAINALSDVSATLDHLLIVQNNEIVLDEAC